MAASSESASESFDLLEDLLEKELDISDRRYLTKTYKRCFLGKDLVQLLIETGQVSNVEDSLNLGNLLLDKYPVLTLYDSIDGGI